MDLREAVKVLMLSPMYFRMDLKARMILVREFCEIHYLSSVIHKKTRASLL
ncbi:MAG: hypothetical protein KKG47_01640 [Proteobacteria bacterium]|nr:hypothetical protein [Pseudomonadota bacterium]MBU1738315.1 hypothetical protein [Pseudomonadota bacterium]